MAEIGAQIELSEGDLVMTINKTIDLMRQVWEMLVHVKPEHPLGARLRQAELPCRDIVEHSPSLGYAPIELPEFARSELEAARAERPPSQALGHARSEIRKTAARHARFAPRTLLTTLLTGMRLVTAARVRLP